MEKNGINTKLFTVQNLKCQACSKSITNALGKINGIKSIEVDVENAKIKIQAISNRAIEMAESKLSKLGYPVSKSENNTLHKINSFVSCAKGKLS